MCLHLCFHSLPKNLIRCRIQSLHNWKDLGASLNPSQSLILFSTLPHFFIFPLYFLSLLSISFILWLQCFKEVIHAAETFLVLKCTVMLTRHLPHCRTMVGSAAQPQKDVGVGGVGCWRTTPRHPHPSSRWWWASVPWRRRVNPSP